MKILQICPHYVPAFEFGGVLRAVHGFSRELAEQGHEVKIVTTNLKNPEENLEVPVSTPVSMAGLTVFYESVPYLRYWGYSPGLAKRIRREIPWADLVILHFHYQFASFIGGRLCRKMKKPFLVFAHGSLNRHRMETRGKWRKIFYINLLERANFKNARYVVYQSEEETSCSLQPGRTLVVPNGLSDADCEALPVEFRNSFGAEKTQPTFLYLGRLDRGKGLDLLLPAFAKVVTAFPRAKLLLAGADERKYERELRRLVNQLDLQQRVTFTGFVDGDEKLKLWGQADVFVLPSRSDTMSIAMLEAMAKELPVLITDRVGLHTVIRNRNCGLVVPCDVDSLAEGMKGLALPGSRDGMGQKGRELVLAHYRWKFLVADLVEKMKGQV